MAVDKHKSQICPAQLKVSMWGGQVAFSCLLVTLVTKLFPHLWQNVYNIVYSQAVTHPSTNTTRCCLTSVIGRELVLSTWYGRRHLCLTNLPHPSKLLWVLTQCYFLLPALSHLWQKFCHIFDKMSTTSCIPRRSPIQVLTRLNVA